MGIATAATPCTDRAQRPSRHQVGFSLVELAIVLIIIGLIVGGVLKGQDLIESARVNSIQTQLNEVRVASSTFLNKYDALPGDITQPDVAGAAANSAGDGNSRIEAATTGNRINVAYGADSDEEAINFWYHLQIADLLGGIDLPAACDGADVGNCGTFDANAAMQARVGGGVYTIAWDQVSDGTTDFSDDTSHWIVLGGYDTGTLNDQSVLTPTQLRTIDQRGDDGRPGTGLIQGFDAADATAGDCVDATPGTNDYVADDLNVTCIAGFRL